VEDKIRRLQLVEAFTLILRSQSFPSLKACIVFATFFQTAGVMKITNWRKLAYSNVQLTDFVSKTPE
jgi:hypothetical protein